MTDKPTDLMKPWTIKSVPTRMIEDITAEARRENVTVGQLLERVWQEHQGRGRQVGSIVPDLTLLLHAAAVMASSGKLPREVHNLINDMARQARGRGPAPVTHQAEELLAIGSTPAREAISGQ